MLTLSIVIPAYNEALRLVKGAAQLDDAIAVGAIDPATTELIVVDDGSTDDTGRLAESLFSSSFSRLRILRLHDNVGKGGAVRAGVAIASAPVVAFMDADLAVDPRQTPLLISAANNADVAIGSRTASGSRVESDSARRALMGRTFNRWVNALTDIALGDTQCGFKAFRTPVARILFHLGVIDRFAFDVEVLYLARRLGFRTTEVPVHWRDVGGSTVRPVADPLSMALDVLRLRRGTRTPSILALSVSAHPGHGSDLGGIHRVVSGLVDQTLPILPLPEGRALILFPLCQPADIQHAARRIRDVAPHAVVRERSISFSKLMDLAPLNLLPHVGVGPGTIRSFARQRSDTRSIFTLLPQEACAEPEPTFLAGA